MTEARTTADRLESAFTGKLMELGRLDLVEDFQDIILLIRADALINRKAPKQRSKDLTASNADLTPKTPPPEGFVLLEEVREAVKQIKSSRFRASRVYELLHEKFPDYIGEDKKASISATLSNLGNAGELGTERDGQRKVWYSLPGVQNQQSLEDYLRDNANEQEDSL